MGDFSLLFGDIPGRRNRERPLPLVGDLSPFPGDIPGSGKCAPFLLPRSAGLGERGVSKGGKGIEKRQRKQVFSAVFQPYFPPLVLFLSEAFFLERKKAGKALHGREKSCFIPKSNILQIKKTHSSKIVLYTKK